MLKFKIITFISCLLLIFLATVFSFSLINELSFFSSFNIITLKKIDLAQIGFFYGEVIINFINFNSLYFTLDETKIFLGRPLFIPLLITAIYKISNLEFFIILIKNIILFSVYFYAVNIYFRKTEVKKIKFLMLLAVPFLLPYNAFQALQIVPEESYLVYIIPAIFLCILSKKNNIYFFSFLMLSCLFIKSPNVVIVLSITVLIFFKNFEIKYKKVLVSTILIFSMIWCFYGYKKSNILAALHKSYTVNVFTGLQSHNIFFEYFYPEYSVDNIVPYFEFFYQKVKVKNEKNFENIFNKEMKNYRNKNILKYLKEKVIIINHTIFNIYKDGEKFTKICNKSFSKILTRMENDQNIYELNADEKDLMNECKASKEKEIRLDFLFNKIIWISALCFAFLNILLFKKNKKISFLFIYFNIFYLLPYIYGHIYTRHQIVLFAISFIFLILSFDLNKKKL